MDSDVHLVHHISRNSPGFHALLQHDNFVWSAVNVGKRKMGPPPEDSLPALALLHVPGLRYPCALFVYLRVGLRPK